MRILLIEDDKDLCQAIRFHLEREGYTIDICHDGEHGLAWLDQQAHDLILLDRMLPAIDGVTLLSRMRAEQNNTPVLMITALDGIGDRVAGLDAGADDYLVKPFAIEELLARVRALARRPSQWESTEHINFEDISLDLVRLELSCGASSCTLSKREAQLLEVLIRNPRQTLPRNLLFSRVWGPDAPVEEGNLDNYIHFLRRRLRSIGSNLQIKTERSVGYRLLPVT